MISNPAITESKLTAITQSSKWYYGLESAVATTPEAMNANAESLAA